MNFQQTPHARGLRFYEDPSFWSLLVANVITIALAFSQKWDFYTIAWIYWFQSVIIGIFNFFRILNLEKFSTENFYVNGKAVQPTRSVKISTALFFLGHYNAFHIVYLIFLAKGHINFYDIWIPVALFFINHFFSFRSNAPKEKSVGRNIGSIMFFPYARIIPMHLMLTMFFSSLGNAFGLVIFLILKTIADLFMHVVEHRWWQSSQPVQ